jgi:hypothetical protein
VRARIVDVGAVVRRSVRAHALGGRADGVVEAVRRAAGVYGSAPSSHLGLVVRARGYKPADLNDAVLRERVLVRVRAMRGSVYLVPRDLVPHALALTPQKTVEHYAKLAGIAVRDFAPLANRIEAIVGERPRTAAEIREALGERAPGGSGLTPILARMSREGRIVRATVRGSERSQSYEYARMKDWIDMPAEIPSLADALRPWASLWMGANGPAAAADFAWWAGVSLRDGARALDAIGAVPMSVKGIGGKLLATRDVLDELTGATADDREEVHLLPCWDAYVMSHRDRTRYLDGKHEPFVVDRMGNVTNVVLRGGRIAGIWDAGGATLLVAAFEKIARRALEAAAKRLAPVLEIEAIPDVQKPIPLTAQPKNAFLSPLKSGFRS